MKNAGNHYRWLWHYREVMTAAKAAGMTQDQVKALARAEYRQPLDLLSNAELVQLRGVILDRAAAGVCDVCFTEPCECRQNRDGDQGRTRKTAVVRPGGRGESSL
jgi:hypothetical protein